MKANTTKPLETGFITGITDINWLCNKCDAEVTIKIKWYFHIMEPLETYVYVL